MVELITLNGDESDIFEDPHQIFPDKPMMHGHLRSMQLSVIRILICNCDEPPGFRRK
jgi:hypothetical protein